MFSFDFTDKIVLVTGATRGIGRSIALNFASLGATVCGTATSEQGAQDITQFLDGKGFGFVMNGLELDSVDALLDKIIEKCGRAPDILVNNAGITRDTLFMRMKNEDWDAVLTCNLTSVARLTKACISPMMKARTGRIINITSITGQIGNAGQTNYAAAKAGMIGFTKSLAQEVASRGITVNCVAPGFIETDMTKVLKEEQLKVWTDKIPLKRAGTVDDIAASVVFLASDMASYITGATIDVNGGLHCN